MNGVETFIVQREFSVHLSYPSYNTNHFFPIVSKEQHLSSDNVTFRRRVTLRYLVRSSSYSNKCYPFGRVMDDDGSIAWEYYWGEV